MSDNRTPTPAGEPPRTPPRPPAPAAFPVVPTLPAYPVQPAPQPAQNQPVPPSYTPTTPPAYAPYGAPVYPAVPAPRPTSGLAITSLICGIAGVVLVWAIIPVLASIAAVITGHMALGQTRRDPGIGGRGMAIAGLILGYAMIAIAAFTLIGIIISFLFVGAFSLPFILSR
ncbi:DUF4190 domain-containing protein [Microbacterium maritypicum]|uniref:DUF4190 domain-containing protein n=1 Tax=Microbacterium maritypicum TaxID=33918 RepID=A0AAJ6ASJ8_MICMQ|nr:DUF4190 domain-containing protein [Microbacterium liquefaciens]WEF22496.1 DUF4190 domain-containing protein [Microbacterium liquefaciens]